jgi:hypothetical protein
MVLAMRSCLAMIVEKRGISKTFESPENKLQITLYAACINYGDCGSMKGVHSRLSSYLQN